MGYCFIISRNEDFTFELGKYLKEKTTIRPVKIHITSQDYFDKIKLFDSICDTIQTYSAESLRESRVVIDELINLKDLNPLSTYTTTSRESLFAMLALAFPELQFTFLNHSGLHSDQAHFNHWLDQVEKEVFSTPLFDPDSIRNMIRQNINNFEGHNIKKRSRFALSIEDEQSFAYFHGYTAYKMGYRCGLVTREEHLKDMKKKWSIDQHVDLQFEDIYLNFPDRTTKNLSDLQKRDETDNFPFLKRTEKRVFISVGHRHSENYHSNKAYIRWLKLTGKKIKTLYKPSRGIYDVIDESGHIKAYWKNKKKDLRTNNTNKFSDSSNNSHSTPGILLVIAEKLLYRSQMILENVPSVPNAIHSAMLALEAKELLGGRTPTTSIRALALQHKAEVTAESMFFGVEYSLKVKERFKDIKMEVEAITHWFRKKAGKRQGINARLHIVEILAKRFSEFNQFEEEIACLAEARQLQFKLWRNQHIVRKLVWPFQKYIEVSLYSIPRFFVFVFIWMLVFGGIYYYVSGLNSGSILIDFTDSFIASARFFFTWSLNRFWTTTFYEIGTWGNAILALQGIISFFNLSLLLSHLYLLVSRR